MNSINQIYSDGIRGNLASGIAMDQCYELVLALIIFYIQVVVIYTAGWFNAGTRVQNFITKLVQETGDGAKIRIIDVDESEVRTLCVPAVYK